METAKKKSIGFGFRGWILVLYQALAFVTWVVFTNFPMNILANMYGGQTTVSTLYSVGEIVSVIIQIIFSRFIGKIKSVMKMSLLLGLITLAACVGVALLPPTMLTFWMICFFIVTCIGQFWCTFTIGIIVGQWFPTRKGTVMGIATFAFPITNAFLGIFAGAVFGSGTPQVFSAFLPWLIIAVFGWLIGLIFIKDYPEQVGAYRDNDKNLTPEIAKQMMFAEIENKKTTVWTTGNTLKSKDFWLVTIPMGLLLMCSVGFMTQMVPMLMTHNAELAPIGGYTTVTYAVAVFAVFGSWLLGVLDTKLGTKKAITIATILMIISSVIGIFNNVYCSVAALLILALYEGAASNFTVSAAAQYWRREDFPSVFSVINPVANIFNAFGPMVCAFLATTALGYSAVYIMFLVSGIVSAICIMCFKGSSVKITDDKYRSAAGKPLDDALMGRK